MAEPVNTPMNTAPPTRSTSPVPPLPTSTPQSHASSPTSTRTPQWPAHSRATSLTVPVYGGPKPVVLHIGDPVKYNPGTYAEFSAQFDIVRPSADERARPAFIAALKEKRWGDFAAIFRPFWSTGGEMGNWDAELIDLLPNSVRVFASAGSGFDWADVELLGQKGIIYCNSGLAAAEAVADFAVALIISTFRALPYCISSATSPTNFQASHEHTTALSHNLRGHVLGLVGFGNIGQQIAHRCVTAFGMEVTYYDIERKSGAVEAGLHARYCMTLESLIRGADCVVLCTPSSAGQIINADSLRWFKPGARLVNVARGALVDEEALADALEQDRIGSIALDVHANEPNVSERLSTFAGSRALFTCHNAGGTVETHIGFEELSMRNIMAVLSGREPVTPVNLQYLR
ncbi:hypothetical protein F5B22DRAFT_190757 [Xylaria bambusicola]|uniref:uncharacterized protein n=1 Tax=Xylaria bambusicola TaxID=326684 RepID=UPI0020088B09|nr:uncharacterized protein F5B22DRAFT_190757 [Xylaria bambusicola]KAI0515442.1 hypothetical protein F5B22DRAFT_190757 [Xylaria bambusicola]